MLSNIRHVDLGVLRGVATAFTFLGSSEMVNFQKRKIWGWLKTYYYHI
jgi:hypothetical protein